MEPGPAPPLLNPGESGPGAVWLLPENELHGEDELTPKPPPTAPAPPPKKDPPPPMLLPVAPPPIGIVWLTLRGLGSIMSSSPLRAELPRIPSGSLGLVAPDPLALLEDRPLPMAPA